MSLPPLLLGFTLLFWGWEAHLLPVAVIGAVILELPRLVRWRWDFSQTDLNRVWDFCTLLFVGAMIYSFAATDLVAGPTRFLPWLPVVFFPFAVTATYSSVDRIRYSTYFLLRRKYRSTDTPTGLGRFVPYWYLVICFVAASSANARDLRFYAGAVTVGGWLLWTIRSRTAPVWSWVSLLLLVIATGYQGHIGLSRLQGFVENKASQILGDITSRDTELNQTHTAIGSVGKLKSSGQIILRVQTDGKNSAPERLRKASFNLYQSEGNKTVWAIANAKFTSVSSGPESTTWVFRNIREAKSAVTISMFLSRDVGILPVPSGSTELTELFAGEVQTNWSGSVRVHESLPLARFAVKYNDSSTFDASPSPTDLVVPAKELEAVAQIVAELQLAGQPPMEVLQRVDNFFQSKFTYSTYLKSANYDPTGRNTPLREFLLHTRAGHCEYFATAATLLLRQAGIPARYATGYAVPEASSSSHVHIVRSRHAHAWALAYVNGAWREFDATPGNGSVIEEAQKSIFEPVEDFFSAIRYSFTSWRYFGDRRAVAKLLVWPLGVVLLWFLWRLVSKKNRVRRQDRQQPSAPVLGAGHDSEFYLIEQHFAKAGLPRRTGEPLGVWADRLATAMKFPPLRDIIALHYAYRFDPQGFTTEQRRDLQSQVEQWLARAPLDSKEGKEDK